MSFEDIFKKQFLEGWASTEIGPIAAITTMLVTALLALYIFFVYRIVTKKTFYSKTFDISIAGVSVITAAIILTIQSNIVISLGMVGALSIVRFRTAIKDPMDLMFLFWSISVGIICGAGLAQIAIILSLTLTIGIFVLNSIPLAKAPTILIVNSKDINIEDNLKSVIKIYSSHFKVKSRNVTNNSIVLTIELRTNKDNDLVKKVNAIEGVVSVSLLSHDGEVTF